MSKKAKFRKGKIRKNVSPAQTAAGQVSEKMEEPAVTEPEEIISTEEPVTEEPAAAVAEEPETAVQETPETAPASAGKDPLGFLTTLFDADSSEQAEPAEQEPEAEGETMSETIEETKTVTETAPETSAPAEKPHWIHEKITDDSYLEGFRYARECRCSECGFLVSWEKPVCPRCGVKMD